MIAATLAQELSASPGRFGLIERGPGADEVVAELEAALGASRCPVGERLTLSPAVPSTRAIEASLRLDSLLVDIEILFAPELRLDPLSLLRRLARASSPRLAVWPGSLVAGRARFSEAQRDDYYDRAVEDVLIFRPVAREFPDQPCFEIERWVK
jgi:hypothetical protein